jgi:hypothetical protein
MIAFALALRVDFELGFEAVFDLDMAVDTLDLDEIVKT